MSEPTSRFWEIFFEVFLALSRQGPGSRACTARALALCEDLPAAPAVLDLGGVGGHLGFSDAVWLTENPPAEVREIFEQDYPTMGRVADVVATISRCGFELLGHFTLPHEAWWDDLNTPMLRRVRELRVKYATDGEALAALDQVGQEPEFFRQHSEHYACEFFVARRHD